GLASTGFGFTVTPSPPIITGLSPSFGLPGTLVTISGANFGATQDASTVTFNGTVATPSAWSESSVSVQVPDGAMTGPVVVTVGGVASNGMGFSVGAVQTATPTLVQHVSS